jgi:hypothetical protein
MENPILKIKRNINTSNIPSGLTSGELFVNLVTNTLYVGDTYGISKPICGEVTPEINLNSNSNYKIPTQKAVKSYIDNIEPTSTTGIEKRKTVVAQANGYNTNVRVLFTNIEGVDNLIGITYSGGTFTNITQSTITLNVQYAVNTLTPRPSTSSTTGCRLSWIQTSDNKIYGSKTERTYDSSYNNFSGTTSSMMTSQAIFQLDVNQAFTVFHKYINTSSQTISIGGNSNTFNNNITVFRIS